MGFRPVISQMLAKMTGLNPMGGMFTFVIDPLVAKSLKHEEGYDDPRKLSEWLVNHTNSPFKNPEGICFVVVGGETNPMWIISDLMYQRTVPIDPWIPKNGVKKDEKPLRMPVVIECADGSCGIH